ncbi:MAG TPA: aspartate aminotransferase family protein [Deltaproteobacteria bacterium]|jgi:acetylornithine aminotransferase|nr:aspartate aminotransferase family protein [Deltaproteobacteria bacterium]HIJ75777.1 aspartate aminotransferase family protein [Deltaproteobacteria bacterium]
MNALIDGIEKEYSKHICGTYTRFPVAFVRGAGCRLWDDAGKEYLDFLAGIAVCGLGHCHPEVAVAISEAARKLVHVSNLFYTYPQLELAAELTRLSFADKLFFCNSGAEANEAAIKLARKYSRDTFGPGRFHIISMNDSFHGRTMATLSATGQSKIHKGFEPLVEGFVHVDFNSVPAVEAAITDKTCAVMVEPVQGEGGLNFPAPGYLRDLKALCKQRKLLLIFDEVQSGLGRTGSLFAYEQEDVTPDIMTLAKALANGLPMGAMLAVDEAARAFTPGSHASTFGGGPLVASAALATLRIISEPAFLGRVRETGAYFISRLQELKERYSFIKDVRGRGLLVGLELAVPGAKFVSKCMDRGAIINCTHDTVLRFVPPLIAGNSEIDEMTGILEDVFKEEVL